MAVRFEHVAITGASSGIGAALAEIHAAAGVRLALAGRNADRLAAVAERCRARGAEVETTIVDVTDAQAVEAWIAAADAVRPLDLVYANAGLGGVRSLAGPGGEAIVDASALVATNLGGVVATATAAIARMVPRRRGRVVLIGSLAGRLGLPHSPVYSATKAGVAVYADGLRRLTRASGVGVTLIEPGYVVTPMSRGVPGSDVLPWSAERAARAIRRAAEQRRAVLRFPWLLDVALVLARLLPRIVVDVAASIAHRASLKDRGEG